MVGSHLLLIAIWLGLGYGGYRLWRRFPPRQARRNPLYAALGLGGAALWGLWPFYEVAGRTMYYDAQVKRLCAQDGGISVYMAIRPPGQRFDKHCNVPIPSIETAGPQDEYHHEREVHHFRTGNPAMSRENSRIVRRSDGKVLGEAITYNRGGGDPPGPWQGSSLTCPTTSRDSRGQLEQLLFCSFGCG